MVGVAVAVAVAVGVAVAVAVVVRVAVGRIVAAAVAAGRIGSSPKIAGRKSLAIMLACAARGLETNATANSAAAVNRTERIAR